MATRHLIRGCGPAVGAEGSTIPLIFSAKLLEEAASLTNFLEEASGVIHQGRNGVRTCAMTWRSPSRRQPMVARRRLQSTSWTLASTAVDPDARPIPK